MSDSFVYRPLVNIQEQQTFAELDAQCFLGSRSTAETYVEQVGTENLRVICQNNEILGGLSILPMGQWWGGQWVPMAGVAAVCIKPEFRGNGSAIALMRYAVREMYEQDMAVSVLYPAAQKLYRKAGYEQGGTHCRWEIRTEQIQLRQPPLSLQSIELDVEQLKPIYAHYASQHNGLCDRHPSIWAQIIDTKSDELIYCYHVGSGTYSQGYIVFVQTRERGQGILTIRDWAAITMEAAQTLFAFLHHHRSQVDRIYWHSGVIDPMLPLLPEQTAQMVDMEFWMLRLVNVPLALEKRGYPVSSSGELHFRVTDDIIEENTGSFVLTVQDGKGIVTQGGRGDLEITMQGLASLYTGHHQPKYIRWLGWIKGTDESLAIATQLFSGSSPWLADFF